MRISDWSSDVCSSDLSDRRRHRHQGGHRSRTELTSNRERRFMNKATSIDTQAAAPAADTRSRVAKPDHVPEELVRDIRSAEHTSELQSLMRNSYAVFCLKKKK